MAEPTKTKSWGIIRVALGSAAGGGSYDAAAWDGWYSQREDALLIAKEWAQRYPSWLVALVKTDTVWFGQGDFGSWKGSSHPITFREHMLARGHNPARPTFNDGDFNEIINLPHV
jgi:hypothetical protein